MSKENEIKPQQNILLSIWESSFVTNSRSGRSNIFHDKIKSESLDQKFMIRSVIRFEFSTFEFHIMLGCVR
jgi:hypothetical protein